MIAIIAAISNNQAIGKQGTLPWHLPNDLKHFKQLTLNHTVIMGRKTFLSIGKPLPQRQNIVVTQQQTLHPQVICVPSLKQALLKSHPTTHRFIIGGQQLYHAALALADTMYLTQVNTHVAEADAFFPPWNTEEWQQIHAEHYGKNHNNDYDYTFITLSKRLKKTNN
jgi:dihydrofolate reductase